MKNIVITGHNGFIGSHLVDHLITKNNLYGISLYTKQPKIKQIKKDIRKINIKDIPKNLSCIIHLAAMSSVDDCNNNPKKCMDVNFNGTQRLLEIARKKDCNFIFASTSHVYGKPSILPISETHSKHPQNMYPISKLSAEYCCEYYAKTYGLDISIIRLFSVYGDNAPPFNVINKIVSGINNNSELVLGNIEPKRDFIYVKDVVSAINFTISQSGFNSFNIGYGKSYSISDIIKITEKISNKKANLIISKNLIRKNDIQNIVSDNTKLKKLGWRPKFSLESGIRQLLHKSR